MPPHRLELVRISKSYPGVLALDDVSMHLDAGEVLGLIGENGAGKSTLMKILGGVVAPSQGEIRVDGNPHAAMTVNGATKAGIAFVHQELNLFENLDVAANVFIGREACRFGLLRIVDHRRMRAETWPLLARLGAEFTPDTPVAELSIAQRQLVEIAKALSIDARVIIMDEPTSSLTLTETERLLRVIADLKAHGVAIIYITHRLDEIVTCADRLICLRDGRVAGALASNSITPAAMIRLMIGRDLKSLYIPPATDRPGGGCEITGLVTAAFPDRCIDLSVRRGEILGMAGLVGSGRTSMAQTVFGTDAALAGSISLDGARLRIGSPRDAIGHGIYLIPEDRKRCGLILEMPIVQNISLASLDAHSRLMLVDPAAEAHTADAQCASLSIRAPGGKTPAVSLSGGNQQKVVLAKWLSMQPSMVIFDEPTRGIDVGAKGEIYRLMRNLADRGVAILMISSDMEEVIGVSDRIAVMHEGRVSGILEREDFSEHNVLHLAIGDTPMPYNAPASQPAAASV